VIGREVSSTAQSLRNEFDVSFSEIAQANLQAGEALLALKLGGNPYALRISEISALTQSREIALLPGRSPAFLGLAGSRGRLIPVWDLPSLLGYAPSRAKTRWLALAAGEPIWALAFEDFEGYLHLPKTEFHSHGPEASRDSFSTEFALSADTPRPVLSFSLLLKFVQSQIPSSPQRSIA
jgi:chemotaxis signal transduction protein